MDTRKVNFEGQEILDEPVYAEPKVTSIIAQSLAKAFGSRGPRRILLRYERVRLEWITP